MEKLSKPLSETVRQRESMWRPLAEDGAAFRLKFDTDLKGTYKNMNSAVTSARAWGRKNRYKVLARTTREEFLEIQFTPIPLKVSSTSEYEKMTGHAFDGSRSIRRDETGELLHGTTDIAPRMDVTKLPPSPWDPKPPVAEPEPEPQPTAEETEAALNRMWVRKPEEETYTPIYTPRTPEEFDRGGYRDASEPAPKLPPSPFG